MSSSRNFYEILNCTATADIDELRSNYKQLILQSHPDKLQHQSDKQHPKCSRTLDSNIDVDFVAINEAWNTLKDPTKRRLYDAELLLSKFETHSNVYARLTLSDMQRCVNVEAKALLSSTSNDEYGCYYYTYDCRCGGQYIIDESTDREIFKHNKNKSDNKCTIKNDKNEKEEEEEKEATHSEGGGATISNDEDADVMIECSECSLVIVLNTNEMK